MEIGRAAFVNVKNIDRLRIARSSRRFSLQIDEKEKRNSVTWNWAIVVSTKQTPNSHGVVLLSESGWKAETKRQSLSWRKKCLDFLFQRTNSTTQSKNELSRKMLSLSRLLKVFVPGVVTWQISRRTVLSNLLTRPRSSTRKTEFSVEKINENFARLPHGFRDVLSSCSAFQFVRHAQLYILCWLKYQRIYCRLSLGNRNAPFRLKLKETFGKRREKSPSETFHHRQIEFWRTNDRVHIIWPKKKTEFDRLRRRK